MQRRTLSLAACLLFACSIAGVAWSRAEAPVPTTDLFLSNARQLVFEGLRSGEGYFDSQGKRMIFQSEREPGNPFYQIYTLDLETGDSARVSTGKGKTTCAFFQPGTNRILFAATHDDPAAERKQAEELAFRASGKQRRYSWDYDPEFEIYTAREDGSDVRRLTQARGYDAEASFSPDGQWIAFSSTRHAFESPLSGADAARLEKDPAWFGEIYLMRADGSDVRRLTTAPGYDGGPFFSPDGTRIVWRRFDEHGMIADIYTMALDGTGVTKITDFACMSWAPYFHPSGEYLIFTANKLGFDNFELFLADAKGLKAPVRVTHTNGFDGLPVFAPNGKQLCWTSNRTPGGKSQLHMATWDHEAALAALRAAPARDVAPAKDTAGSPAPTPAAQAPAAAALEADVRWLADPARGGRSTGSEGARATAAWLTERLSSLGFRPVKGDSFAVPFEFAAGEKLIPDHNMLQTGDTAWKLDEDFRPIAFSDNGVIEGEVIFAGYGLSVPGEGFARYNSYDGIDVKDKIVLLFRYVPEGVTPERRAQLNRYAGLRYKAMLARERGAKAVIFVSGPNSGEAGKLIPLSGDNTHSSSGIVALSVSAKVAEALFAAAGKSVKTMQDGLDIENPHVEGAFAIPNLKVKLEVGVEHIKKQDVNIAAYLAPDSSAAAAAPGTEEFVLLGAHYDHLGAKAGSSSLARSGEETSIHPGADDNGSGVAVVLDLAAALARERAANPAKFRRGIAVGFWSGEEIGLIGSSAFAEHPPIDLARCAAYINFDMVGRMRDQKLTLQGVGSSDAWKRIIEKRNVPVGLAVNLQDDPYLPTDTTAFYPKRVPVLNFFTGAHDDYHRPTDTAEKINYEGMTQISRLARGIITELVTVPERIAFSRVQRTEQKESGSRETLRAYLGTIPDYTSEVKGVKISGVRGGSPADKAGLVGADIIVELGGQKISNIYDYTYALDAVKIGTPVKITVERSGEKKTLEVTPEARK